MPGRLSVGELLQARSAAKKIWGKPAGVTLQFLQWKEQTRVIIGLGADAAGEAAAASGALASGNGCAMRGGTVRRRVSGQCVGRLGGDHRFRFREFSPMANLYRAGNWSLAASLLNTFSALPAKLGKKGSSG